MLLLGFLLLHVALTTGRYRTLRNYTFSIHYNNLTKIGINGIVSDDLNLSNLNLEFVDVNALRSLTHVKTLHLSHNLLTHLPIHIFSTLTNLEYLHLDNNKLKDAEFSRDLSDLKTLNLSNNLITSLPTGIFSKLKNLEYLDLENNNLIDAEFCRDLSGLKTLNLSYNLITSLSAGIFSKLKNLEYLNLENNALKHGGFCRGLRSLKTLNIVHNPLRIIKPFHFVGLPKSTDIMTHGIQLISINSLMFERKDPSNTKSIIEIPHSESNENHGSHKKRRIDRVNCCIKNGRLKSLKNFNKKTVVRKNCHKLTIANGSLDLTELGIESFKNGWYDLQRINKMSLNFYGNKITKITKHLLNKLPRKITKVYLQKNQIKQLNRGVIRINHIMTKLDLSQNLIWKIEDDALENIRLHWLDLSGNRLKNTKFLDSLPLNIERVELDHNKIKEISAGNFSKFHKLRSIDLQDNRIREAKAQSLWGLSSLKSLVLSNNRLTIIEPGFFNDVKNLRFLQLSGNRISSLDREVFTGLGKIVDIDLSHNKLKTVPNFILPLTLERLYLDKNEIQCLKGGDFIGVPKIHLSLVENNISKIESESLDLPKLEALNLRSNSLTEINDKMFERLENIRNLTLTLNNITRIRKGATKNLKNLDNLNLELNPIKRLTNGALFGLPKEKRCLVQLSGVDIEMIQSGLFDDV